MKFTRLYTGEDNQSHFEDCTLETTANEYGKVTDPIAANAIVFGEAGDDRKEFDWHNPLCRQYIITLKGCIEIEVGDGSKRSFKEGEIFLAEDLEGQGHITRSGTEENWQYLAIPV